jgi:hypothetical protein
MRKMIIAAALAAATATAPAAAQVGNSQGLIAVNITDVNILNDFLNDTQIAALNEIGVPVTVQVPISVAANVCGTTVNALGALRKEGNATCDATSGSQALADIVQRQKLKQNKQ